jgi:hypothetical protein
LVELLLGGVLLLIVGAILWNNQPPADNRDQEEKGSHSKNARVVTLTAANWQKEVLDSPIPVIVDFWRPG